MCFDDFFGGEPGDFFNIYTTGSRNHHHWAAAGAIIGDAEVNFFFDIDSFVQQYPAYGQVFNLHREDLASQVTGFIWRFCQANAARFATPPHQDLGFDNYATAQFFGDMPGFFSRIGHAAAGNGDIVAAKNMLGLVFVKFHPNHPNRR